MTIAAGLVLLFSALAAVSDVRTRRIPNVLVLALFASGLIANAFLGWQHLLLDAGIAFAVLLVGTFAFSFKLIGGGDVKLLAAAAGTLGYPDAAAFIFYTLLSGGVIAVLYSALRGRLGATFANMRGAALPLFAGVRPVLRVENGTAMPYALAIFAGACFCAAGSIIPQLRFSW